MCAVNRLTSTPAGRVARPAPEAGHVGAALIRSILSAPHAGAEQPRMRAAIVGHEDHERILGFAQLFELRQQAADVVVDVGDHRVVRHCLAIELLTVNALSFVQLVVLRPRADVRRMRSIGRNVGEEWRHRPLTYRQSSSQRLGEEQVSAVALRLFKRAVVQNRRVEVLVVAARRRNCRDRSARCRRRHG